MKTSVKVFFYIAGICSIVLLSAFGIPSRQNLDYDFAELPSKEFIYQEYFIDNKDNSKYRIAKTFNEIVNHSSLSLIDFIIIALIEVAKVLIFDKPIYLDIQDDNQVYDVEKIPTYIVGKKKRHLLDDKEIPIIKLIITTLLIVKDILILPLSLIAYEYNKIDGLVQFGMFITHTLLSPQVLISLQHLAYSRLGIIQDIADDTEIENGVEKVIVSVMHGIRIYICAGMLISLPLLIVGSVFGVIVTAVYSLATLGLFVPGLLISFVWKRRGFSNRQFIPLNLIIFVGVGLIFSLSYINQFGNIISDGQSVKTIFQYYFGPNTFSLWYFAHSSLPINWKDNLNYLIRIIAVI